MGLVEANDFDEKYNESSLALVVRIFIFSLITGKSEMTAPGILWFHGTCNTCMTMNVKHIYDLYLDDCDSDRRQGRQSKNANQFERRVSRVHSRLKRICLGGRSIAQILLLLLSDVSDSDGC